MELKELQEEMYYQYTVALLLNEEAVYHTGIVYKYIDGIFCIVDILQEAVVGGKLIIPTIYSEIYWAETSEPIECEYVDFGFITCVAGISRYRSKFNSLHEVVGNSLEEIGESGFSQNTSLVKVYAPNVKHVGHKAFYRCYLLEDFKSLNLNYVGHAAFAFCYKLTSLNHSSSFSSKFDSFLGCVFNTYTHRTGDNCVTLITNKLVIDDLTTDFTGVLDSITIADKGTLIFNSATDAILQGIAIPSHLGYIDLGFVDKGALGVTEEEYAQLSGSENAINNTNLVSKIIINCATCLAGMVCDEVTIHFSTCDELVGKLLKLSFLFAYELGHDSKANLTEFIDNYSNSDSVTQGCEWNIEFDLI